MAASPEQRIYDVTKGVVIASAKRGTVSALYGIGINKIVTRFREERELNIYEQVPGSNYPGYSPDAFPDGKGGYIQTIGWDGRMSSSLYGMPVMSYLKFVGGRYRDLQGNVVEIPDITFETVIITLTMGKDIVKSHISGRDSGSIKEYIAMDDWQVEIRAVITADAPVNENVERILQTGAYPRDNMQEIWRILQVPCSIPVESWYLKQFGIKYLVIDTGVQIEQVEGEYSVQRLVIPCLSDNPLVITVAD